MSKKVGTMLGIGAAMLAGQPAFAEPLPFPEGPEGTVALAETGDVLLVPYYTTESGNETYINVVNTTDQFKALKVRFREARGSEDSLDFHVYMSPEDAWTAALTQDRDGVPTLVTGNSTCTFGRVGANADSSAAKVRTTYIDEVIAELAEYDLEYAGPAPADRVREGYVEIIEMATLVGDVDQEGSLIHYIKHEEGEPRDCRAVAELNRQNPELSALEPGDGEGTHASLTISDLNDGDPIQTRFGNRNGGLFGSAALINVESATYIPMHMAVLDTSGFGDSPLFFAQSAAREESLAAFTADRGLVLNKDGGLQYWDLPDLSTTSPIFMGPEGAGDAPDVKADAVSLALRAAQLANEFLVDPALNAATDWVVTLPTKRFYVTGEGLDEEGVASSNSEGTGAPRVSNGAPFFTEPFDYVSAQACEDVRATVWDREERQFEITQAPDSGFSPGLPAEARDQVICWEANVFEIVAGEGGETTAPSSVLGARVASGAIPVGDHAAGWVSLDMARGENELGLPAIGFAAWQFANDGQTATGSLNQYGGAFRHRATGREALR